MGKIMLANISNSKLKIYRHKLVVLAAAKISKAPIAAPQLEDGEMPMNTFNNKNPFKATVLSVERIVGPNATGDTRDIVIKTDGKIPYWEGQSYGVIPPGTKTNSKGKEVPHGVRLYSIAASRYGDSFDGQTTTLCVAVQFMLILSQVSRTLLKKGFAQTFSVMLSPDKKLL